MSAREGLAAVLAAHSYDYPDSFCDCAAYVDPPNRGYPAHLADVILRDWLPGALADERVVQAAAAGVEDELQDPHSGRHDIARAALTAAVTALTEEDA